MHPRSHSSFCCGLAALALGGCAEPPGSTPSSPAAASAPTRAPAIARVDVGDEVVLDARGATHLFLATDDGWDGMLEAQNRRDAEELSILLQRGQVAMIEAGQRAKVLDTGIASRKVRVRGGPFDGFEGWIQGEFVRHEPLPRPVAVAPKAPPKPTPAVVERTNRDRAAQSLRLGKAVEAKNPKGAAAYYREAIEAAPDSPEADEAAGRLEVIGDAKD